jgi:serine/threonine protein phosphatase PrpC
MSNQRWNSWGVSAIGPLHITEGIPNQDSWMKRRYKWGNVIVVSDGLGSKAHSDHGSKAACLSVFEAAKSYHKSPESSIVDILRLVHANWIARLAPYSPSDCAATCLFAIQSEEKITIARIGDGMIAVDGESGMSSFILKDDKQDSFSNYTDCLESKFKPDNWETKTIESAKCKAIVLCTDGISDDLLPEKRMSFFQELYTVYRHMDSKKRNKDLRKWLHAWPVPGHSDDKTIACLHKREVTSE